MKKNINLIYWYIFLILFLEVTYRFFIWGKLLDLKLLLVIFFSIPFTFLFYFLSSMCKQIINMIITFIISFLITLIYAAQFIYYQFYKSIFSVFSLTIGTKQVFGEYSGAILEFMIRYWYVLLIMFLPFTILIMYLFKNLKFKRENNKVNLILFAIFITIYVLNIVSLSFMDKGLSSNYRLYNKVHSPMLTINRLGLLTMEKLDIKRYLFGFTEELGLSDELEIIPIIEKEVEYNILDIDFDTLIEKEENPIIKEMHAYFKNSSPSNKNEYTGIFKEKNLIFITAEALDISAIREETTPTLYKMLNSGFVFKNYYQPLYPVSTSDGEYMNLTSLIPKEGVWSFYRSSKIYMPYGIGNIFKNLGYKAYGYHNHTYDYYDRDLSHTNIGLDYIGCGNGLEKRIDCSIWPESDLEMIKSTVEDYVNEENFMAYYMTVSGHLRYNFFNSMAVKNLDKVKNLNYSDSIKAYLATNIELDRAMESLLDTLKSLGKLDDTLIVISPDHYPYGLKVEEINQISNENRNDKFNLYHTSLIMYNPTLETKIIDDYVSSIDILPTIYNLFGIEFDSRLLMGRDIFSDSEKTVILSDRSWMTSKGKYDSITGIFTPFEENITDEYVATINNKVYQKFTMSSYILDRDYYSKIGL